MVAGGCGSAGQGAGYGGGVGLGPALAVVQEHIRRATGRVRYGCDVPVGALLLCDGVSLVKNIYLKWSTNVFVYLKVLCSALCIHLVANSVYLII